MGQRYHCERISNTFRQPTTNIIIQTSQLSPLRERSRDHRTRDFKFTSKECHRGSYHRNRFQKPTIFGSKKDWGPETLFESETIESIRATTALQNGIYESCTITNKQKRLYDKYRPFRCFSPCFNAPLLTEISTVRMEQQNLPISSPPLRAITVPPDIHQNSETRIKMGKTTRNQNDSLSRRPFNHSSIKRANDPSHATRSRKATVSWILDKRSKVNSRSHSDNRSPGIHDKQQGDDSLRPNSQSTRYSSGSKEDNAKRINKLKEFISIYRKSHGNDSSSIPSSTNVPKATTTQKRRTKERIDLVTHSSTINGSQEEPILVDQQSTTVERPNLDRRKNPNGRLHRCVRQWLGHRRKRFNLCRAMERLYLSRAHQRKGTTNCPNCNTTSNTSGEDPEHHLRQYDNTSSHTTIRRDSVTTSNESRGQIMASLFSNGDQIEDNLRPINIQPRRCSLTQDGSSTRMEHRPAILRPSPKYLGTSPRRSLRLSNKREAPNIHDMETSSRGTQLRRLTTPLVTTGQLVPMSTMEPNLSSTAKGKTRKSDSNANHPSLAQRDLVPYSQGNGNPRRNTNSERSSPTSSRNANKRSRQESSLDTPGLANKRTHYEDVGLSQEASNTILNNPQARRRFKTYGPAQKVFIDWARDNDKDPMVPNPILLINYLAFQMRTRPWNASTALNKRSAILSMYTDKSPITNSPTYQEFISAIKSTHIRPPAIGSVNISPALDFIRSLPVNDDMSLLHLTQKLCWLLGICGFMRADDIRCIDVTRSSWTTTLLKLLVTLPKEKRNGNRIEKTICIQPNKDPTLCPVAAYASYIARLTDHPLVIPHPKDESVEISPLIRSTRNLNVAASSQTISNHMDAISRKIPELEGSTRRVKPRALGSSAAAGAGIPIDDIIAHGNWSSSDTFANFYRTANLTKTNFSEVTLNQISGVTL